MSLKNPDSITPTPKTLAWIFLAFFGGLVAFLFYPISKVFDGTWKLHQKIDLADQVVLDFEAWGISGLTNSIGFDSQIPIGTISVRYYSICLLVGLLAGYFLAIHLAKFHYIAATIVDRILIGLIIVGLIGARLFFVLFNLESYLSNPLTIFTETLNGGLAFFGMLLAGFAYIWIYCKRFKFNFYEFLDFIAPAILIGQVIGRWGNFFNYESYGSPTSVYWKMFVPETANFLFPGERYFHPTFLYEIILNFILLFFILYTYRETIEKRSGLVFSTYAIGYGTIRFFIEFFRLDALKIAIPENLQLTFDTVTIEYIYTSQIAALILLGYGIYLYYSRSRVLYLKKNMMELKV